jgi:hypothetical protein
MPTDWSALVEIDRHWHSRPLEEHFDEIHGLARVKIYTVKVSGTEMLPDSLVDELHTLLPDYVFSRTKRQELGDRKAGLRANHFFGKTDPASDGKFGELLLFALVESVLGCKMVGHKIRNTTNRRDQAKGGDGIFLGEYLLANGNPHPACLIGESKVVGGLSEGLESAFDSINRFHEGARAPEFRATEYIVARDSMLEDERVDLKEVYARLNPTSAEFRRQVMVHPILIMFDNAKVKRCLDAGLQTPIELEAHIKSELATLYPSFTRSLNTKLARYPECARVQLHFFLIPYDQVNKFRDAMYYAVHGVTFS